MAHAPVVGFEGVRDELSWRRAHEELVRIAKKRAGLDFEEGRRLLRAFRAGTHVELGFGSFNEYCERLFGYGARLTQDKLRVAEALEGLPETARALEAGSISFSAARELTRVAIPSTEREWLEAATNRTVREVEQLVSGHRPGSRPDDAPSSEAKRHVLSFEVSGETLATFREAMAKIRRDAGDSLDEDAALLLLSRHVLAGPRDEGRSSYQVALTVCESCRRGTQQGRGELVDVSREAVEMAECDEQHLGHVNEVAPGAHVGALDRPTRAKQSIAPATRRQVLRRDGGRCRVPGCRHATFVDVHHLRLRSEDGTNDVDNLVTLCAAHHHAIHEGRLLVEGTPSTDSHSCTPTGPLTEHGPRQQVLALVQKLSGRSRRWASASLKRSTHSPVFPLTARRRSNRFCAERCASSLRPPLFFVTEAGCEARRPEARNDDVGVLEERINGANAGKTRTQRRASTCIVTQRLTWPYTTPRAFQPAPRVALR